MRTIKIEFTVSERQYEYLKLAKSEQPNAQRIKMMLLSGAASTLRREGEMVMAEARGDVPKLENEARRLKWEDEQVAKLVAQEAKPKRYKSPSQRELDARKAKLNRKPDKVLRNSKADSLVPFTPTPLEDYEF